ncbi:MAG: tetratricopeptide repeat protein [Lentisphaeraceae bacterium]|nr:tetratricopeptide repeat protein [Lentisphaeraceae bacterium]
MRLIYLTFIFSALTLFGQSPQEPVVPAKEVPTYRKVVESIKSNPAEAQKLLDAMPATRSAIFDYLEGALLFNAEQGKKAEAHFLKAIEKFPDFFRAHESLSAFYLQEEIYDKALDHLFKVVKFGRAGESTWKNIAYSHINNGNFKAAEEALENVRIFTPKDKTLDATFLDLFLQQNDYKRALPLAMELLDKNSKEKKYWHAVISCYQYVENSKEALRHFLLYDRLFDLTNDEKMRLAGMLYNDGLYKQAGEYYGQVTGKLQSKALLNKASCALEMQDYKALLITLKEPLQKATPDQQEKYFLLKGNSFLALDDSKNALKAFEQALKFNSTNFTVNFQLAQIYDDMKQYDKALDRYERASKGTYYASSALMRKARIHLLKKESKQALEAAERALQIDDSKQVKSFYNRVKQLATD